MTQNGVIGIEGGTSVNDVTKEEGDVLTVNALQPLLVSLIVSVGKLVVVAALARSCQTATEFLSRKRSFT